MESARVTGVSETEELDAERIHGTELRSVRPKEVRLTPVDSVREQSLHGHLENRRFCMRVRVAPPLFDDVGCRFCDGV